ncbi:MAG: tetratricopeptide repeat protein [Myxococcota bacterium]|nr:tetratricopeptide repeat protein [Myxococcota bacterium]
MSFFSHVFGWRTVLGVTGAVALPLLLAGVVGGARGPAALERADALVLEGELDAALALYTDIEAQSWSDERAATAAWHAGSAAALAGADAQAIAHLETFLARWPGDPRAASASAQLGVLLADSAPREAADHLVSAAELAPQAPSAADRMLQAAALLEKSERTTAAWTLYERSVRSFPERAPEAWIAMARMRLEVGDPAAAQELYEKVLAEPSATELHDLARLGLSIAQEDLGDFDAVLAELHSLDLSEAQREQRRERVMGRVRP